MSDEDDLVFWVIPPLAFIVLIGFILFGFNPGSFAFSEEAHANDLCEYLGYDICEEAVLGDDYGLEIICSNTQKGFGKNTNLTVIDNYDCWFELLKSDNFIACFHNDTEYVLVCENGEEKITFQQQDYLLEEINTSKEDVIIDAELAINYGITNYCYPKDLLNQDVETIKNNCCDLSIEETQCTLVDFSEEEQEEIVNTMLQDNELVSLGTRVFIIEDFVEEKNLPFSIVCEDGKVIDGITSKGQLPKNICEDEE